jgi:excisionase family DNA binding protein
MICKGGISLKQRLTESAKKSDVLYGNLLGIQRRIRTKRQGWEEEVLRTVIKLFPIIHNISGILKLSIATMTDEMMTGRSKLRRIPDETPLGISTYEAAKRLKVHTGTVLGLLKSGRLRGRKVSKSWRISPKSIEEYIQSPSSGAHRSNDPAETLNKKSDKHEWITVDNSENTIRCIRCNLVLPAALPWEQQLGIANLNTCKES